MLFFRLGKKKIQPKSWELCFTWWTNLRRWAWNTTSQMMRSCFEEEVGEPGYIGVFATKPDGCNIKRLLLRKISQISQVKEFSSLCVWKNPRVWSHWYHLSYVGPVSCASSSRVSSGCLVGEGGCVAVLSAGWAWQWAVLFASTLSLPQGSLRDHSLQGCNAMASWKQRPLFTDRAGSVQTHMQMMNGCLTDWMSEQAWLVQAKHCLSTVDMLMMFLCWLQSTVENSERDGNTGPPDLPLEKFVWRSGSNS